MMPTPHAPFRALIERDWTAGDRPGLAPPERARLHDHLRSCEACRAHHDRIALAFRALAGDTDEVSGAELELVERWIAGGQPAEASVLATLLASVRTGWRAHFTRRPVLPAALLAGAAAVVAVAVGLQSAVTPPGAGRDDSVAGGARPRHEMSLVARGAGERPAVSVNVLCGPTPAALRPAAPDGCALDETLAFAFRAAEGPRAGVLVLFGVDAEERVLYYAPTPVESAGLTVNAPSGEWAAAPVSVRLGVNHHPGAVRLFALLAPTTPSVAQLDAWGAALASAEVDHTADGLDPDRPWHRQLHDSTLDSLCGAGDACHSAWLDLNLREENR